MSFTNNKWDFYWQVISIRSETRETIKSYSGLKEYFEIRIIK